MSKNDLTGRCGLYCGACDIYRVFVDKRKEKQRGLAEYFKCRPEQVRCQGCQNPTPEDWGYDCKIIKCLDKNGYTYCSECQKIKACEIYQELNGRYNNYPYKNLKRLKELGEEKWLEEMTKRWTCPQCKAPIEYDDKKCSNCGFDLTTIKD